MVSHAWYSAVVEVDRQLDPLIAVFLAMIEMLEDVVLYQERLTVAGLTWRLDQRDDTTGILFGAAVIVRPLPEAAGPPVDSGAPRFNERKVLFEDQRAVAEYPVLFVQAPLLSVSSSTSAIIRLSACRNRLVSRAASVRVRAIWRTSVCANYSASRFCGGLSHPKIPAWAEPAGSYAAMGQANPEQIHVI